MGIIFLVNKYLICFVLMSYLSNNSINEKKKNASINNLKF